jgi:hypothetical protein
MDSTTPNNNTPTNNQNTPPQNPPNPPTNNGGGGGSGGEPPYDPPTPPPEDNGDECECPEYPPCPEPIEEPECQPTFVPITLEIAPIVDVLVNKPKVCLINKAKCKPCFFLDKKK